MDINIARPGAYLLLCSLPLLVLSESKSRSHAGTCAFKMLSSAAFLSGPLLLTSADWTPYRILITTGLLFSLAGDFFLLPAQSDFYNPAPRKPAISLSFHLGIVAFALAHVAYIAALLHDSPQTSWPAFGSTFLATMLLAKSVGVLYPPPRFSAVWNALDLDIPADLKPLVSAYAVIISSMFAAAVSTMTAASSYQRLLGPAMFVVSDLFVAKNAFGRTSVPRARGSLRIATGYGLYFWGQMLIAGTVRG